LAHRFQLHKVSDTPKTKPKTNASPKKAIKKNELRFSLLKLKALLASALAGDAHRILGLTPKQDIRTALGDNPPEWKRGSYEKLIALYIACELDPALSGVIYDFAEHTYFRYDDDGYQLQSLNTDLARLYATHPLLKNNKRALSYLEAALAGPYPPGVKSDLKDVSLFSKQLAAVSDEVESSDEESDSDSDDDAPSRKGPA
jgi:hypothetical protein